MENKKKLKGGIEKRKMKILASLTAMFLVLSLFSINVLAQEEASVDSNSELEADSDNLEAESETSAEIILEGDEIPETENGGTTPDSIFWGLDRALERIDLALTLNKAKKARKGLEHARERLLETREMIKLNKLEKAEKSKTRHEEILEKVKLRVKEIETENPEEELEEKLEIENELSELEEDVEKVETEIEIKVKGKLTAEQQASIERLIESFKGKVNDLKVEIEVAEGKVKTRIKAKTGKSDEEIEDDTKEKIKSLGIEDAKNMTAKKAIERADKVIEIVEDRINKAEEGNRTKDMDLAKELVEKSQILLEEAKSSYESGDYTGAIVHANKAKALILRYVHAKLVFDKEEKEKARERLSEAIKKLEERKGKRIEKAEDKISDVINKLEETKKKLEERREKLAEEKEDEESEDNSGSSVKAEAEVKVGI